MIIGVGIDVVEIARIASALSRTPALAGRLFAEGEQDLPVRSLAARFAAKEAVAKALGAPAGLRWTDAEVVSGSGGMPRLAVHGTVAAAAAHAGVRRWHLSLSHDAGIATAVAVAEGEGTAGTAEGGGLGWF